MKVKRALLLVESDREASNRVFNEMKEPTGRYAGMAILSFPDFETLGRVITPARLEILTVIRRKKPASMQALARLTGRDFKNVYQDVKALEEAGLVELKAKGRGKASAPSALFEELVLAA